MSLTEHQREVYERVKALRELSRENGMSTTRSQNALLQRLSPEDLAVVAQELLKEERKEE